jgi:hypothetical protein
MIVELHDCGSQAQLCVEAQTPTADARVGPTVGNLQMPGGITGVESDASIRCECRLASVKDRPPENSAR